MNHTVPVLSLLLGLTVSEYLCHYLAAGMSPPAIPFSLKCKTIYHY